jgi:hypothetical protein
MAIARWFNEITFGFVRMKFLAQSMILTRSKLVKEMPQALQINKKTMAVIKLVFKDDYFSKLSCYNNRNITTVITNGYAMKEGSKCKLKLGFWLTNTC